MLVIHVRCEIKRRITEADNDGVTMSCHYHFQSAGFTLRSEVFVVEVVSIIYSIVFFEKSARKVQW